MFLAQTQDPWSFGQPTQCSSVGNVFTNNIVKNRISRVAIMRFKKGTKVEVLSKREVPSGAWRSAEIILGNGHYYTVRFESYAGAAANTERVSRKTIRPLPPPLEVIECWAPGDIVEVFENFSWKMATVSKVFEKDYFLVRLLGSSLELRASKFNIRARQSWQYDEWIIIGWASEDTNEGKPDQALSLKCKSRLSSQSQIRKLRLKLNPKGDVISPESKEIPKEFDVLSYKGLKRRCYSRGEPYGRTAQKIRTVDKDGRLGRPMAAYPSKFPKQVHDIFSQGKTIHERYSSGSTEYRTDSFLHQDAGKRRHSGTSECSLAEDIEREDTDSVASSVGSCSMGMEGFHSASFSPAGDVDNCNSSDAESFCGFIPPTKDSAAELHRLELNAYRCTMERLHASGPITWEQEAWITNLRLTLNISNDEHLMEIRNLISADNSVSFR